MTIANAAAANGRTEDCETSRKCALATDLISLRALSDQTRLKTYTGRLRILLVISISQLRRLWPKSASIVDDRKAKLDAHTISARRSSGRRARFGYTRV